MPAHPVRFVCVCVYEYISAYMHNRYMQIHTRTHTHTHTHTQVRFVPVDPEEKWDDESKGGENFFLFFGFAIFFLALCLLTPKSGTTRRKEVTNSQKSSL